MPVISHLSSGHHELPCHSVKRTDHWRPMDVPWLAVVWAGSQGIENRFGLAGIPAVICVAYSQDFRNSENPLLIAAYIHAMSAWN